MLRPISLLNSVNCELCDTAPTLQIYWWKLAPIRLNAAFHKLTVLPLTISP
jgi:hypothetical protein